MSTSEGHARAPVRGGRLSRNARRESTTDPSRQCLHLQLCSREIVEIFYLLKADIPHTCVVENEGGKDRSCRDERRWCGRVRRTVQVTVNLQGVFFDWSRSEKF